MDVESGLPKKFRKPFKYRKPPEKEKVSKIRVKPSLRKKVSVVVKEYSMETTIHGLAYISSNNHPKVGRIFWLVVVILAILATTFQLASLYNQWEANPVVTILDTVSLPMDNIQFPAFTVCPQGFTASVMDNVLMRQFKEYLKNKIRRGEIRQKRNIRDKNISALRNQGEDHWKMTRKEMLDIVRDFLREVYPGAKNNPTQLATMLITEDPGKLIQNQAILNPTIEEEMCNETNLDAIVHGVNKELNLDFCPPTFTKIDDARCVHLVDRVMSYDSAAQHCNAIGGKVFELKSYKDIVALEHHQMLGNKLLVIDINTHNFLVFF